MFLVLSKILPPLLYPLGLACLLIALALFLRRRWKWQRACLILALLVLWAGGTRWVAWGLTRSLEWRYLPPEEIPEVEVAVILGGATHSALYPRSLAEVNGAGDRVLYALWLYRQGKAERLLLSGGSIDWLSADENPARDMASLLELIGVPAEAIWLEAESRNTYENAAYARELLQPKGIERVILVTSALHMPRSVALFEAQGLEVIPCPTDYNVTQPGWEHLKQPNLAAQLYNLLPSAENLSLTTRALKEYLGLLAYRLRGWL